jgi:hypothetical protein
MSVMIGEGPPPTPPTDHWFYNGTVHLRFYADEHIYRLVRPDEEIDQDGTTTVVHIIDKSNALIPWGCKVMADKLLPSFAEYKDSNGFVSIDVADLELLVLAAKSAHKEKLDEAAEVGKRAHAWIERHIRHDEPNPMDDDLRVQSCCRAALRWIERHNVRWIHTEHKIYSRQYGFAGTMDGLALCNSCDDKLCCPTQFEDRLSLIDWKSSNQLNLEYLFQAAAYEGAYEEEFRCDIIDRWIVRMGKEDDAFETWHLGPEDFDRDFQGFLCCLELTRTMFDVKERMQAVREKIRAEEKRLAKIAKEEALKIRCKNAADYKGVRRPACNKGNPCQACLAKYAEVQAKKVLDKD